MKVHKGDTVLVIAGKDKGAKGKVIQAYPTRNKVLVEGVNRIKKHTAQSANQRGAQSGGIVTQEAAIHVSNVMVVDADGKPARRGYRGGGGGEQEARAVPRPPGEGHRGRTPKPAPAEAGARPRLQQRYRDEIRKT